MIDYVRPHGGLKRQERRDRKIIGMLKSYAAAFLAWLALLNK
jgi:hypothetical protein